MQIALWRLTTAAVGVMVLAASSLSAQAQPPTLRIKVSNDAAASGVVLFSGQGQNATVTVTATDAGGKPVKLDSFAPRWTIDNPDVVSLAGDDKGVSTMIVGQQDGHAIVTVTALGQTASLRVAVGKARNELKAEEVAPEFRVARLEISASGANEEEDRLAGRALLLGENGRNIILKARAFNAAGKPVPLTSLPVVWSTGDADIMEIDAEDHEQVRVIGRKSGETTVTATLQGVTSALRGYVGDARNSANPALLAEKPVTEVAPQVAATMAPTGAPVINSNPAQLPITLRPEGSASVPITTAPRERRPAVPQTVTSAENQQRSPQAGRTSDKNLGVQSGATVSSKVPTSATTASGRTGAVMESPSLAAPTNVRAEPLHYRGTVMVHWDKMPGAVGYDIVQWLPNGKYAGANPINKGSYGGEATQGITMELATSVPLSVIADYGSGQYSPPSPPVSVSIPRWYGRYRISLLGFRVERETADDPTETDGKRDEVYLRAAAAERGPDGERIGNVIERQTLVHGDINTSEWRSPNSPNRRIKAGSASADGGLRTGDGYPSSTPWQRGTTSNSTNTFPLLLWEGDLAQGQNSVQAAFLLWESDQRPGQSVPSYASFSPEASALERAGLAAKRLEPTLGGKVLTAAVAGVVLAPTLGPLLVLSAPALVPTVVLGLAGAAISPRLPVVPKAATPLDGLDDQVGITAASLAIDNALGSVVNGLAIGASNYVADFESGLALMLNVQDRPLGVRKDAQGNLSAIPGMLTLTFENAEMEALSASGPAGKGAGIYEYKFADTLADGNGIYAVYLQVERVQ